MAGQEVHMRVWRGDANGGEFKDYRLTAGEGMVVLDIIHAIQATQANDLAVRWNCKAGKCGSCSAEVNGKPRLMCMTRMNTFEPGETITVAPIKTFPIIRDLVTDVSFNYEKAKSVPAFKPKPKEADGTRRMFQEDIDRVQEFHKCIECFLCQDVCHVIRDHEENKQAFAGPRLFVRLAALEMHPLDTNDRMDFIKQKAGLGLCNITKCCTEVCPEHIHITDNAIIPLKERVVDRYSDPVARLFRLFKTGTLTKISVRCDARRASYFLPARDLCRYNWAQNSYKLAADTVSALRSPPTVSYSISNESPSRAILTSRAFFCST
jgi:succinate dehydrogenase / fumarate reductase iron-sulfur subunit